MAGELLLFSRRPLPEFNSRSVSRPAVRPFGGSFGLISVCLYCSLNEPLNLSSPSGWPAADPRQLFPLVQRESGLFRRTDGRTDNNKVQDSFFQAAAITHPQLDLLTATCCCCFSLANFASNLEFEVANATNELMKRECCCCRTPRAGQ